MIKPQCEYKYLIIMQIKIKLLMDYFVFLTILVIFTRIDRTEIIEKQYDFSCMISFNNEHCSLIILRGLKT